MNKKDMACSIAKMETELALMKAQMDKSCNDLEIDYKRDGYFIEADGGTYSSYCTLTENLKQGRYRETEALAKLASSNMRKRDKLEEMVMWLDPDWRDVGHGAWACYIYTRANGAYAVNWNDYSRNIGTIYMSKETANTICDALNSGEFTL